MKTTSRWPVMAAILVTFAPPASTLWAQGGLTPPPGAPAPLMKKLDEVEPRTNLQATPVPTGVSTGNAAYDYVISAPGSYYLSANLAVIKANGIQINAEGVTVDLNGFEISRATSTGGNAIEITAASHRASIRNGSIKGFANGVQSSAHGCAMSDLAVSLCTSTGISAGNGAVLESCRVHNNSGTAGISGGTSCVLSNCTAYSNTAARGIAVSLGATLTNCSASENTCNDGIFALGTSTLTGCAAYANTSTAAISVGINAGSGSTLAHCSSTFNNSTATTLTATTGMGFKVGSGSTIQNCTATGNRGDGINIASATRVLENTCDTSGNGLGDGAGIHATGADNRIESNNVTAADRGIDVDFAGNLIIKNSASGNTINFALVANNVFGAIVDRVAPASAAVGGSSAASSVATTDPWANISY